MRYATAIVFFCTLDLLFCGVSNSVSVDRPLYGELHAMPQDIHPFSASLSRIFPANQAPGSYYQVQGGGPHELGLSWVVPN